MSRKCLISAGQLFSLLLVSSLIIMVTTNSTWTGGRRFFLTISFHVPLRFSKLYCGDSIGSVISRRPTMNILDHGYHLTGWFGTDRITLWFIFSYHRLLLFICVSGI